MSSNDNIMEHMIDSGIEYFVNKEGKYFLTAPQVAELTCSTANKVYDDCLSKHVPSVAIIYDEDRQTLGFSLENLLRYEILKPKDLPHRIHKKIDSDPGSGVNPAIDTEENHEKKKPSIKHPIRKEYYIEDDVVYLGFDTVQELTGYAENTIKTKSCKPGVEKESSYLVLNTPLLKAFPQLTIDKLIRAYPELAEHTISLQIKEVLPDKIPEKYESSRPWYTVNELAERYRLSKVRLGSMISQAVKSPSKGLIRKVRNDDYMPYEYKDNKGLRELILNISRPCKTKKGPAQRKRVPVEHHEESIDDAVSDQYVPEVVEHEVTESPQAEEESPDAYYTIVELAARHGVYAPSLGTRISTHATYLKKYDAKSDKDKIDRRKRGSREYEYKLTPAIVTIIKSMQEPQPRFDASNVPTIDDFNALERLSSEEELEDYLVRVIEDYFPEMDEAQVERLTGKMKDSAEFIIDKGRKVFDMGTIEEQLGKMYRKAVKALAFEEEDDIKLMDFTDKYGLKIDQFSALCLAVEMALENPEEIGDFFDTGLGDDGSIVCIPRTDRLKEEELFLVEEMSGLLESLYSSDKTVRATNYVAFHVFGYIRRTGKRKRPEDRLVQEISDAEKYRNNGQEETPIPQKDRVTEAELDALLAKIEEQEGENPRPTDTISFDALYNEESNKGSDEED